MKITEDVTITRCKSYDAVKNNSLAIKTKPKISLKKQCLCSLEIPCGSDIP